MEEETRKSLRGVHILLTIALFAAFISFGFSYVLFRDVNIPLQQIRTQELSALSKRVDGIGGKLDYLLSSRLNEHVAIELQKSLLNMRFVEDTSQGAVRDQAQKAAAETKALLDIIRGVKTEE